MRLALPLLLLAAALGCAGLAAPARAEVRVSVNLSPELIEVGMGAGLTVTVEGAARIDAPPEIPPVDGLQIVDRGQSTQVSIVNGRMSRSIQYQFAIFGRRVGTFPIGPVVVREGGKEYRSRAISITVNAAGTVASGARPNAAPRAGGAAGAAGAGESRDLFLRASVDRERAIVGEQITLRLQLHQRVGLSLMDQPTYAPPETPGFWREDLPPQRNSTSTIDGIPYEVTEIVYALFPTQTGKLEIGPSRVVCTVRARGRRRDPFDLFGGLFGEPREVELTSRPLTIQVNPLPQPAPTDFTGGVGDYRLTSSVDRTQAAQNEPVTWTVKVSGRGNVSAVGDPRVPEMVGWRAYPPTSETKSETSGDLVSGTKTFQIVLLPGVTGRVSLPPISISVYDPKKQSYQRLTTAPTEVEVLPGATATLGGTARAVARVGRDLRGVPAQSGLRPTEARPLWREPGFWLLQLAPLGALGWAWGRKRRAVREGADRVGLARRRAHAALRAELDAVRRDAPSVSASRAPAMTRLGEALESYLSDRFSFAARGCTRSELRDRLTRANVPSGEIDALVACLDRCDLGRFAPAGAASENLAAFVDEISTLVDRIERATTPPPKSGLSSLARAATPLRLLAITAALASASALSSATDALAGDRGRAEQLFVAGREAYAAGQYAAALDAFRGAAAEGYESPALWLGVGNASYKTGELGWAVHAFERGRRLAPDDPDLRANLELALEQTSDRVLEANESRSLSTAVSLLDRLPLRRALLVAAGLWWAWAALCALTWTSVGPRVWWDRLRPIALAGLGIAVAWSAVQAARDSGRPDGVVVAAESPVRSNPTPDATIEFTLHGGTLVRIGRERGDYVELLFSERLRGWAERSHLAELDDPPPAASP